MDSGIWAQMDDFPRNGPHTLEGGILEVETGWAQTGPESNPE